MGIGINGSTGGGGGGAAGPDLTAIDSITWGANGLPIFIDDDLSGGTYRVGIHADLVGAGIDCYGKRTDASNYHRMHVGWNSGISTYEVAIEAAGAESASKNIRFLDQYVMQGAGAQAFYSINGRELGLDGTPWGNFYYDGYIRGAEISTDPALGELLVDDEFAIYRKNDKLVISHNVGGVQQYLTIALDGSTTAWVHGTTAP